MKRPVKSRRGDDGRHSIYVLASTHAPSDKPTPFCLGQSASEPITQRRRRGNDAPKSVAPIIKSLRQGFPSPSSPLIHAYHSTKQCAQRPFCASSPLTTPLAPRRGNTPPFCCRSRQQARWRRPHSEPRKRIRAVWEKCRSDKR
jgi:hypothetical protein